jgi:hypothetical protein
VWGRTLYREAASTRCFGSLVSRRLLRLASAYHQERDEERPTERHHMSVGSLGEVKTDIAIPVLLKFAA